jgi:hypothetical protein
MHSEIEPQVRQLLQQTIQPNIGTRTAENNKALAHQANAQLGDNGTYRVQTGSA